MRRYRALIDLIRQLPEGSRYREALLNDDETAELIVANEDPNKRGEQWKMRISDTSAQTILQTRLIDSVERLTAVTVAAQGKKYKPKPVPRAETAIDRARERRRLREVNRLFDLFTTPRKGA
ncbi:hypothetical protein [Brevibacterium gallinarum]|uniref:Transposase n=1 Tax=Brevibacterium gallinarum TaxID=2762220 RepID=A0ABR8WR74_9MICO|nr:hypothetical protein [Brevibacterium gallinarum]MBD8019393.1 hypothetical protein [Brevibacterium gallinarum]